jgi:hypothetical protein
MLACLRRRRCCTARHKRGALSLHHCSMLSSQMNEGLERIKKYCIQYPNPTMGDEDRGEKENCHSGDAVVPASRPSNSPLHDRGHSTPGTATSLLYMWQGILQRHVNWTMIISTTPFSVERTQSLEGTKVRNAISVRLHDCYSSGVDKQKIK